MAARSFDRISRPSIVAWSMIFATVAEYLARILGAPLRYIDRKHDQAYADAHELYKRDIMDEVLLPQHYLSLRGRRVWVL